MADDQDFKLIPAINLLPKTEEVGIGLKGNHCQAHYFKKNKPH